jgi:hypothetical protein
LVLKKKEPMPNIFCLWRQPTFRKGKNQNVLRKEDIDKIIIALSKKNRRR